jgi:hypothetical protein
MYIYIYIGFGFIISSKNWTWIWFDFPNQNSNWLTILTGQTRYPPNNGFFLSSFLNYGKLQTCG